MTTHSTTAATSPADGLPAATSRDFTRRPGEMFDRVLVGPHLAITRNERLQLVLVDAAWYNRQPGSSPYLRSRQTDENTPITRADYAATALTRDSGDAPPVQLDGAEAEGIAELLEELAAIYDEGDAFGHLARDLAEMLYLRLGR